MIENGLNLELLTAGKYGHAIHIWDLRRRRVMQSLDLGAEHQMALACWGTGELRCYDVSVPLSPQLKGSVRLGGVVDRSLTTANGGKSLA